LVCCEASFASTKLLQSILIAILCICDGVV
jgi:hypothetical protein